MGTVNLTIEIGDPQGLQFEELDVIAGTRSTYTAVPRATLERLGVPVERTPPSETADGRIVRRRRTDHHQAAGAGVPHPGHIRRTRRAQPVGHGHPRRGRPRPDGRPGGRTSHTQNFATYLTKNTVGPTIASKFHTQVIFAEPGEPSLLGTVTLEEAVLALDPVTKSSK